ncbi:MAG TPA: staygreen family protein [Ureibacillus sp.]|nr:staygreen family protein [Ureibacillus sp.]
MAEFNPQKLTIRYILPASPTEPIVGRKYTLTHSDNTGHLFLDIGIDYNYEAVNQKLRDEVIAEWQNDGGIRLLGKVHIDQGNSSFEEAKKRNDIFTKELGTALRGIIFGDRLFLSNFPNFLDAPIYIYFESMFPQFHQLYYYGTTRQYLNDIKLEV